MNTHQLLCDLMEFKAICALLESSPAIAQLAKPQTEGDKPVLDLDNVGNHTRWGRSNVLELCLQAYERLHQLYRTFQLQALRLHGESRLASDFLQDYGVLAQESASSADAPTALLTVELQGFRLALGPVTRARTRQPREGH